MKKRLFIISVLIMAIFAFTGCDKVTDGDDGRDKNLKTFNATLYVSDAFDNPKNIYYWYADGKYSEAFIVTKEQGDAKLTDGTPVNAIAYIENDYYVPAGTETYPVYSYTYTFSSTGNTQTHYAFSETYDGDDYTPVPDLQCTKLNNYYDGEYWGDALRFEKEGALYIVSEGSPVEDWEIHPTRTVNVTITLDEDCPQIDSEDTNATIGYTVIDGKTYYVATMIAE